MCAEKIGRRSPAGKQVRGLFSQRRGWGWMRHHTLPSCGIGPLPAGEGQYTGRDGREFSRRSALPRGRRLAGFRKWGRPAHAGYPTRRSISAPTDW